MPRVIDGDFLVGEVWEKHRTPICLVLSVFDAISHPNYHRQPTALPTYLYTANKSTTTRNNSSVTQLYRVQHKHLSIDDITLEEELFSRADGLRQDVIDEYREGLQRGDTFPPITVFHDGESLFLVDGFYRYYSYRLEQIEIIEAEIHEGTLRDALLFSASINQQHGVRRSIQDKRRSVSICLLDEEWSPWSDHTIARHCGVSQPFVSKVRHELVTDNVIRETPHRERRDKHGGTGTMNTSNIGRNRQRPQYTFQTTQLFDHMRQIVQSYELSYPGLQVEYEKQRNGLFIRVVKSKKIPAQVPEDVHESLEPFINQVLQGDYLDTLITLPNNSIPIIVSDLPYIDDLNEAAEDETAYLSYLEWMRECLTHLYRIGTSDGRLCLNVQADSGNNGVTYSLYSDILQFAKTVGFQYKSEIAWYQPVYRSSTFGKGSVAAPTIVNPLEKIMILYKHQWEKIVNKVSNIGAESRHLTHGFWQIDLDEQDTSPHLARLPLQIAVNLLKLLSYKDDIVPDAFGAAGSLAVAAKQLGRPFISIESTEHHFETAQERLARVG